ncbi:hypothetical protein LAUMK41_02127 [Mycobacterium attenuatum]|nr:hypothetical protein LAUMK41_02127 [Mycobacterium attenuatum]
MLDGEIAYRETCFDEAFTQLRRAVELDDTLPYDEPWGWMQPTRHAYGALLLEQGHVEEAAAVYAADLGLEATLARSCQHPGNVWSLHGYHECLQRLGRTAEVASPFAPRDCSSASYSARLPASMLSLVLRTVLSVLRRASAAAVDTGESSGFQFDCSQSRAS